MKNSIVFLLFLFFGADVYGQRHDYLWNLGYAEGQPNMPNFGNVTLDFNQVPPAVLNISRRFDFWRIGTTISDSLGNLLFYDNGTVLRNRLDRMMPNGDSLAYGGRYFLDGSPWTRGELALPVPADNGKYWLINQRLFTNTFPNDWYFDRVLRTQVNMLQNNTLGGVIMKDSNIVSGKFNGLLSATKNANGRDWWVIRPNWNYEFAHLIHIGPNDEVSIKTDTLNISTPPSFMDAAGVSGMFSPDGSKYAVSDFRSGLNNCYVIDFDRCEGDLGNIIYIPGVFQDNCIVFSPNSRFLYLYGLNVVQYDLTLPDYWLHPDTVATYQSYPFYFGNAYFFNAELAPDGRVFFAPTNAQQFYHVIQRPDIKGPGCVVRQHGLMLGVYNDGTLPNYPNYRLGALDGSPCDTLGLNAPPLLTWAQQVQTVTEGNTQVALRMRLDRPSADTIRTSVRYVPSYGSATVGQDLDAFPDVPVTLLPGDTSATVYVQLLDDNLPERPDTAVFAIVHPTHAVAPSWYCYLDILDNDPSGTVSTPWAEDILLYPNPAMDYLTIDARGSNIEGGRYALIDALGRILRTGDLHSQKQWLDLRDLPSGLYFLELRALLSEGNEGVKRMKVIKN